MNIETEEQKNPSPCIILKSPGFKSFLPKKLSIDQKY